MNNEMFWEIIESFDWSQQGDDEAVLNPAKVILLGLDEKEILEFEELLAEKLYALDTRAIAKACYEGDDEHFSGDDFLYSRCVVVANGKDLFDEVLKNPELMPADVEFESLIYLGPNAYEEKTGKQYSHETRLSYETCSNTDGWK